MRFLPGKRRLELAAGEMARFGEPVAVHTTGGPWRTEVGREWHEALRRQAAGTGNDWEFEVGVKTIWIQDGWTLAVDGRIDQLRRTPDGIEVHEVKTVSETLPRPELHWRETRHEFFVQLALYCRGLALLPENSGTSIHGTLVLVDPATGVVQEVPLREAPEFWIEPQAKRLVTFAETRWQSRIRLSHLRLLNPFSETRPEWLAAQEKLAGATAPVVLLEAPTGFGKTALALDFALKKLRDGEVARIVYVTGKNSGRIQVQRELSRLVPLGALRVLTLHARDEHAIEGVPDEPEAWLANWRMYGIDPVKIFDSGEVSLESICALGRTALVPPWEITRALLPLAEFILCDYNYLFSPRHAGVLENLPGWTQDETLLIVDEAHNLPARAASARTLEADWRSARNALDALMLAGASREWIRHWEAWTDFLGDLQPSEKLSAPDAYLLRDIGAEITRLLLEKPPLWLELDEDVLETLFLPTQLARALDDETHADNFLLWCPREERLTLECLCATQEIGEVLGGFRCAILMSATLAPQAAFCEACGLTAPMTEWLACDAVWRAAAYSMAVDLRVDTRMKSRDQHLRTTAETVLTMGSTAPVVVFFPSYRYADAVRVFISALDSGFRVATQPAGATPAENAAFIEESLFMAHAIFLVLGGGLAEGIDLLGGRISRAMVVSPGLPEVNPAQVARLALLERRGADDAFQRVYLIPALRKVNQALGRLVRGPGHRAQVLLHCRRFSEPAYANLLAPEYQAGAVVRSEADLQKWLS